jgi:oligoribonuclease NrnB/cAMP/cGMP phosphodiesterase (DHH superfamily)
MSIQRLATSEITRAVIYYHADCLDGFGAYWAAVRWCKQNNIQYVGLPCTYGEAPSLETILPTDLVAVVDFSFDADTLLTMSARAGAMVLLDHHDSAIRKLEPRAQELLDAMWVELDPRHSGAMLAWKFFHRETAAPALINHIEDRDLWKFELPFTKEVCRALFATPQSLEYFDWAVTDTPVLERTGALFLKEDAMRIDRILQRSYMCELGAHRVPHCNTGELISEVGHALLDMYPLSAFSVSYYDVDNTTRKYSLRGRSGGVNVAKIAEQFGGGGHPAAAGFTIKK